MSCTCSLLTYYLQNGTNHRFSRIEKKTKDGIDYCIPWNPFLTQPKLFCLSPQVETELQDVNVEGCKPPWYLWWFKKWQSLLNEGVHDAFEEFANNFQHQAEIPEVFQPFKGVYVHYWISGLDWTSDYVIFEARASVSTSVGHAKNVTFVPETHSADVAIPLGGWNMSR